MQGSSGENIVEEELGEQEDTQDETVASSWCHIVLSLLTTAQLTTQRYQVPLDVLLCLLYGCDGGLYEGNVLHFLVAPCTLAQVP